MPAAVTAVVPGFEARFRALVRGHVQLDWGWQGFDMIEIQVNRGAGYALPTLRHHPRLHRHHPAPGRSSEMVLQGHLPRRR